MFVSYTVENDREFQRQIDKAFEQTLDLRIPFRSIARDFYKGQRAIFSLKSAGGYPDFKGPRVSETWKNPGRPERRTRRRGLTAYQNYKIQKGITPKGYPLLKLSGALEKSVTSPNDQNNVTEITKSSLTLGTTLDYANYHQQDNPDMGNRVIPTRKFLFIGPEARNANSNQRGRLDRWTKIIELYISETLDKGLGNA